MTTKEKSARISAGILAGAVLWAIWPPLGGAMARGEGLLEASWGLLRMFTIITNLLVGIVFARIAWRGSDSVSPVILGGVMLGIVLVGVVFNLLLKMLPHQTIWYAIGDNIHHVIAPIAVPLWWIVFARHGALRWTSPLLWALYPLSYSAYTIFRAQFAPVGTGIHARYPYFFMDPDLLGWPMALANMVVIALGFVLFGMAAVALDKMLAGNSLGDTLLCLTGSEAKSCQIGNHRYIRR